MKHISIFVILTSFLFSFTFAVGQTNSNSQLKAYSEKQINDSLVQIGYNSLTGIATNSIKTEYEYDSNKNNTLANYYVWDDEWVLVFKAEYTYNSDKQITSETHIDVDADKESFDSRFLFTYDNNGNRISKTNEQWNTNQDDWDTNFLYQFTYTPDNKLHQTITKNKNYTTLVWENYKKTENTYNNSLLETTVNYDWNSTLSDWELTNQFNFKTSYTYDVNNFKTQENYYTWNSTLLDWNNDKKYEYTNNANGDIESYKYIDWNSALSVWEPKTLYDYTYNSDNLISEIIQSDWNATLLDWEVSYKDVYTYPFSVDEEDAIIPKYFLSEFMGLSENEMLPRNSHWRWDKTADDWVIVNQYNSYFSEVITSGEPEPTNISTEALSISIYPTICSQTLYIDSPTTDGLIVSVYNIEGVLVKETAAKVSIDVSSLTKGNYIIQISKPNKILLSQKILVK